MINDADERSAAQRTSGARAMPYRNMAVLICRALPYQLCDLEELMVLTPDFRANHVTGRGMLMVYISASTDAKRGYST